MRTSLKKTFLGVIIPLLLCVNADAMKCGDGFKFSPQETSGYSFTNSEVTNVSNYRTETGVGKTYTIHNETYDTHVEEAYNCLTKEYTYAETYDPPQQIDFSLDMQGPSANNANRVDTLHTSHEHDYLHDSTWEGRLQQIGENQVMRNQNIATESMCLSDKQNVAKEYDNRTQESIIYFTAISPNTVEGKILTIEDLINALNLEAIQDKLHHLQAYTKEKENQYGMRNDDLACYQMLLSGQISDLLNRIEHSDLSGAESAFTQLKNIWPWKHTYPFLVPLLSEPEARFVNYRLGVDIMQIAQKHLVTRQDYISHYADAQSLKIIDECKERCLLFQQQGKKGALLLACKQLCNKIVERGKINDVATHICLAIADNFLVDSVTDTLHSIVSAKTIEQAHDILQHFELQILEQSQQKNLVYIDHIKAWINDQYGYDVLDVARNCYMSRPDYIEAPEYHTILSNEFRPIYHTLECKSLPMAHAELVHLEKQIIEGFESLKIFDREAQKKCLIEDYGIDVLEVAHQIYASRPDHQSLVKCFIPIDVQNASIAILENNCDFASVAQQFSTLSQQVFNNAQHCNLEFIADVKPCVHKSIEAIKKPRSVGEFVFNVGMVDRVLGDVQAHADGVVAGKQTLVKRAPALLVRAVEKFVRALNPYAQAKNICTLTADIGHFAGTAIYATVCHPITTAQHVYVTTATACEFLINTAGLVSDVTMGRWYLSSQDYQGRMEEFRNFLDELPTKHLADLTAEQVVDFGAQLAADYLFGKGFSRALIFLKEIEAVSKVQQKVAVAGRRLKKAVDAHLAKNPVLVTAEGILLECPKELGAESSVLKRASSSVGGSASRSTVIKVSNMKEFFETDFGKMLKNNSIKMKQRNQDAVFKILEKVNPDLKKGYFYYLDKCHLDHIEVFNKQGHAVFVLNLDGTPNISKTKAALQKSRTIEL